MSVAWQKDAMEWEVTYDPDFLAELAAEPHVIFDEIGGLAVLLRRFGPHLRRPHCDTLNGSKHANMKELRFTSPAAEWRIAFAFDPARRPSCWPAAVSLARINNASTATSSVWRIGVSIDICDC
jgi:hypothetical protein